MDGEDFEGVRTLRNRPIAALLLALAFALAACGKDSVPETRLPVSHPETPETSVEPPSASPFPPSLAPPAAARRAPELVLGSTAEQRPRIAAKPAVSEEEAGEFTLNFEGADIRDVVKAVLGDLLKLNYTIDPAVQGTTTIHTARPLARSAVLPAVEAALRVAGVALIARGGQYDVVPAQDAARRATLTAPGQGPLATGFHVELVPLKFVAAAEIQRVLEPMVQPGTIVRIDPARNLVLLAGTEADLATLTDTIAVFDVDWMKSQSFALYPLSFAPARAVVAELSQVIEAQGPLAGLVRMVPIERLNAILVVSKQRVYVEEMRAWIDRFDRGGDSVQPRFFVYHVQNGRATDLAVVLEKILGGSGGHGGAGSPGLTDAAQSTGDTFPGLSLSPGSPGGAGIAGGAGPGSAAPIPSIPLPGSPRGNEGVSSVTVGDVRITADDTNNALIIMASPERYKVIEGALQQLDTVPLQVLLEAVVAEVTLTKDLQYGVQYFLQSGQFQALRASNPQSALGLSPGGFSLLFTHGTSITAVLDLLSTVTDLRVVSAPEVMVLNNRTASLQVGDEVPVATASAVSVQTPGAPVVNSIQMRDTGVILHVTPRVNHGGMVLLEIGQEVSQSVPTTTSAIDSPTIQERRVSSTIAVEDGQTVALGGLISDSRTKSKTGIPLLGDIPVIGPLFSDNQDSITRTELLVLVTPHVIHDQKSAAQATEELRDKLPLIRQLDVR